MVTLYGHSSQAIWGSKTSRTHIPPSLLWRTHTEEAIRQIKKKRTPNSYILLLFWLLFIYVCCLTLLLCRQLFARLMSLYTFLYMVWLRSECRCKDIGMMKMVMIMMMRYSRAHFTQQHTQIYNLLSKDVKFFYGGAHKRLMRVGPEKNLHAVSKSKLCHCALCEREKEQI